MKKILICGSMRFYKEMAEWKEKLGQQGYEATTPARLADVHEIRDKENDLGRFEQVKREQGMKHFQKVIDTDAILVLNFDKDGRKNYIGGNTFAEIALAVAINYTQGRNIKVYTLNPLPEDSDFTEELKAWGVRQWEE